LSLFLPSSLTSCLFPYTTLFRSIKWITNLIQGNLGFSYSTRQPVTAILFSRVSPTLQLMGISLIVGYLVAIPLGIYSAVKKNTRSEEHTSELQSRFDLVCRLLLE